MSSKPLEFTSSNPTYSSPITCSSLSAGISFSSPVYSSSFLSPPDTTPLPYAPQSSNPTKNNTISSLRNENSQLVSQSQRLLTELESTSSQLSVAKRKIYNLENKLPKDTENILTPPPQKSANSSGSLLGYDQSPGGSAFSPANHKDDDWNVKQRVLQNQLADVQEECRKLRDACADVEQRTKRRVGSTQQYERPMSSQSWRGFPTSVPISYQAPPTSRYSSIKDPLPPDSIGYSRSDYLSSSGATKHTMSSTSSGSSYKPLDSGLDRSLSGSNTSLSSIKSAREPLTSSVNHSSIKLSHSSTFNGGHGNLLELEKAKMKIRKLEKQVSLMEQQVKEKTKASERHVEELTKLRTLMAQEKASNAINTHQAQEKAASEMGRIRALNTEQTNELQAQLGKLKGVKIKLEDKVDKLCAELKGSHDKNRILSENVSKLSAQIEGERASHRASLDRLRQEAGSGQKRVTELERELKNCQLQLNKCLREIEMEKETKENEAIHLNQQVMMLSGQLQSCKEQLSEASQTIHQLRAEIYERERETREMKENEMEIRAKTVAKLKQSSSDKETLLQQIDAANSEIRMLSQRITSLQESSLQAHQLEGEVLQLRKSLSDQQSKRMDHQLAREEGEREVRRLREENRAMRERLEQSGTQLTDMQQRSEEWRAERERMNKRVKELQIQVDGKQKETVVLKESLQRAQHEREAKENTASLSLTQMKQELTKRAKQVMEMDTLLRSHQAETASKRQELERRLAEKEEDLRTKTEETEVLSQRHAQALKTNNELKAKLLLVGDWTDSQRELKQKSDLIIQLQLQLRNKDGEIRSLNEKLTANREEIVGLGEVMTSLRSQQETSDFGTRALASRDQQITRLKEQVQQLLGQERMKQEEVSRCRAQVVSLSTELAVERQMVQETRQQLAQERASQRHFQVTTPSPVYQPPVSSGNHQMLPAKPKVEDHRRVSSSNHSIIHI